MKTVLITTDFSSCAHNASKYGIELASCLGAKIVLMNVYMVPMSIPESYVIVTPEEVKKTAEDYLLEEVLNLRKSSVQPIEIQAVEGTVTDTILQFAQKYDDCIIVAGMKGEGGVIKKTFGTTATGLARKTNVPLLIVPENAYFKNIETIALAADNFIKEEINILNPLKDLGNVFKSKLFIVKVLSTRTSIVEELTSRSERLYNSLKPMEVEYKFPRADDVTLALNDFSEENNIDILAIIPHHHSLVERIFVKSETRQLIFHTHIPLLVLPDKNKQLIKKNVKLQKQLS